VPSAGVESSHRLFAGRVVRLIRRAMCEKVVHGEDTFAFSALRDTANKRKERVQ
jgi:hypothetical protein